MSGSGHNWLFYGDFTSLFTLGGVLVYGMRCSKRPLWWLGDILSVWVCLGGRGGCLMIRYCIAYWWMCLRLKPGVVGVIRVQIWPSSFAHSEQGQSSGRLSSVTELMDGCCLGQSRAIFHTFPYNGGGVFFTVFWVKHPHRASEV